MPLKEAYIRARYKAGYKPDFLIENFNKAEWEKEIRLFDSLSHEERIKRGLVKVGNE